MKEKVWNIALKGWFEGPEDPDLIILKVTPTQIRIMNTKRGRTSDCCTLEGAFLKKIRKYKNFLDLEHSLYNFF